MKHISAFICVSACCLALTVGCAKKTTKIDPIPEPAPAPAYEPPPPPPEPEPEPVVEDPSSFLVPVYFDYDKSNLRPDAMSTLESIGPFLNRNPSMRIMIEGHADERGTDEYNIGLGESRAKSALNWLVNYGISESRIETVSYGRARPVNPNCGEDDYCHSRNRRVEWKVISR
jgi:peptidoglycan-associated lipoprotein